MAVPTAPWLHMWSLQRVGNPGSWRLLENLLVGPQRAEKGVLGHELNPGELWGEMVGTVE